LVNVLKINIIILDFIKILCTFGTQGPINNI
jgi:hypothetical protein